MSADPNEGRNDPMVPEYWVLGESLQDRVRDAGYDHPTVEGIAIDIHDLLQAADRIRDELAPLIVEGNLAALEELEFEFRHIAWHAEAAQAYLRAARSTLANA